MSKHFIRMTVLIFEILMKLSTYSRLKNRVQVNKGDFPTLLKAGERFVLCFTRVAEADQF